MQGPQRLQQGQRGSRPPVLSPGGRRYKGWSEAVGKSGTSVAVLYCDAYGFCDRLSQTLARGITKANVATEMVDLLSVDPQVGPPVCPGPSLSHKPSRCSLGFSM